MRTRTIGQNEKLMRKIEIEKRMGLLRIEAVDELLPSSLSFIRRESKPGGRLPPPSGKNGNADLWSSEDINILMEYNNLPQGGIFRNPRPWIEVKAMIQKLKSDRLNQGLV